MTTRFAPLTTALTVVERDAASRAVAAARLTGTDADVRADLDEVPHAQAFDLVCAFEVLEHLADDVGALSEWSSFLAPGGHVLISVPAFQELFGPADEAAGHLRRYAPDELRERFRDTGLDPRWVRCYGWPVGHLLEWTKGKLVERSGKTDDGSLDERTAQSGRWLQPRSRASGMVRGACAVPFLVTQRLAPNRGTGLVALARRQG